MIELELETVPAVPVLLSATVHPSRREAAWLRARDLALALAGPLEGLLAGLAHYLPDGFRLELALAEAARIASERRSQ